MNTTLTEPSCCASRSEIAQRQSYVTPVTNIREDKNGYVLKAELPGVAKDGLELTVANNELVITGRRTPVQTAGQLVYRESRSLDYRRAFELDPAIDASQITAKLDQGVLTLTLPKSEAVKPRTITVTD